MAGTQSDIMNEDLYDRVRARLQELVKELAASPRGTMDTRLLGDHLTALGSPLLLTSSERTLEEMRHTARATRLLAYATVVLAIATSASVIVAAIR